jgi:hypothetical protein
MRRLPPGVELPKAQNVRLVDVFLIGPLMFWAGWKLSRNYPVRGRFLTVSGAATVAYNGYNYYRLKNQGY